MTGKWKKANKIPKRGYFDVKSINARPYIQCARVTLKRLSIFLGLKSFKVKNSSTAIVLCFPVTLNIRRQLHINQ